MVQALAPSLKEQGIYIGAVQVTGRIGSNEHFSPKAIAKKFDSQCEFQVKKRCFNTPAHSINSSYIIVNDKNNRA